MRFENGQPAERLSYLANPQRAIPLQIAAVCRISNLDVADEPTLDEIMPALRDFCADHPIVSHDTDIAQTFLSGISDRKTWISLIELAPRVWPFAFASDYSCAGLLAHSQLEHAALCDLPLHRAEGEAVIAGLLLQLALEQFEIDGYERLDDLRGLMGRRKPVHRLHFGTMYRRSLEEIPEYHLRWVLEDTRKPPRLRTLQIDKDTAYAIGAHLREYGNYSLYTKTGAAAYSYHLAKSML